MAPQFDTDTQSFVGRQVVYAPTAAPSMDIQVSSSFERLLADLAGAPIAEQMRGFESTRAMQLITMQREGASKLFTSGAIDADGMNEAMRWPVPGPPR